MPGNPTLYLESTIPSYLAARPSRDLIVAAHQQVTHEWWQQVRTKFDIYISEAVLEEITAGDPEAVSRRLSFTEALPILTVTEEVEILAREYHGEVIKRLQAVNKLLGRETPIIVTPEELLTSPEGG
jgi:hypothetical protein